MEWFTSTQSGAGRPSVSDINIAGTYVYFGTKTYEIFKDSKLQFGYDSEANQVVFKENEQKGYRLTKTGARGNCGMINSVKLAKWLKSIGANGRYDINFDSTNDVWRCRSLSGAKIKRYGDDLKDIQTELK